ncbi:MAG: DUF3488 and transglutaminase-like domain-containing protein [Solirubrobacteraceae bacterium]
MSAFSAGGAGVEPGSEERTAWRAAAFFALAAFASLEYAQLLSAAPVGRLLGSVAVVTVGCATLTLTRGPLLRRAPVGVLLVVATLLAALLALGVPAHLLAPGAWPRLARDVEHGVAGLGGWLWPYRGEDPWSRLAVLLVAPVALLAAGVACFWPGRGQARDRRVLALAVPIGLFVAGAANTPGSLPGLRGLVLLALIAAWVWLPAVGVADAPRATRWLLACGLVALLVRPALSAPAWIDFREVASPGVSFQWDQLYGPISWPRSTATMLEVSEPRAEELRVTSLDRFDGLRFLRSDAPPGSIRLDTAGRAHPRSWYTSAVITIAGLRSRVLAGGGGVPLVAHWLGRGPTPVFREADGTLLRSSIAPSGGLYQVTSYTPRPTAAMLRRAPPGYPEAYAPYAQFELPGPTASALRQPDLAAEARSPAPAAQLVGPLRGGGTGPAAARIEASPYGPMFALARRLAQGASSSYDVANRIEQYLLANDVYDEHVAQARYPLEAFLFVQRRGYCQQFSGAMTLMLRMDGIAARVASGFKPVLYDSSDGTWRVRALDAHSWVEVFFSGIGWVPFDPTPPAPIAAPPSTAAVSRSVVLGVGSAPGPRSQPTPSGPAAAHGPSARAGGGSISWPLALGLGALLLLVLSAGWLVGHLRLRRALTGDGAGAVGELGSVLARAGWGDRSATLARLESQLREQGQDGARRYVSALRELRYGTGPAAPPSRRGRAALRRALVRGRSLRERLRLLLAMPPGAMR